MYALQELLSHAKVSNPSRSDEISKIEKALKDVEDTKNYAGRFEVLEQLVDGFINEVNKENLNPPNDDWLNRLTNIRHAIIQYKNAFADYAADTDNP